MPTSNGIGCIQGIVCNWKIDCAYEASSNIEWWQLKLMSFQTVDSHTCQEDVIVVQKRHSVEIPIEATQLWAAW